MKMVGATEGMEIVIHLLTPYLRFSGERQSMNLHLPFYLLKHSGQQDSQ